MIDTKRPHGRHLAPPPTADALADWDPEEFGVRLEGGNLRWGLIVTLLLLAGGLAAVGLWLYQRPAAQAEASVAELEAQVPVLEAALPTLETFNAALLGDEATPNASDLFGVENAARSLFEASAALPEDEASTQSSASAAVGAALDGIRLAGAAHAYRLAVTPVLAPPELETDPTLIELDEAARAYGDWQLRFDDVRSALPDGVLPRVTQQLDVLSADLTGVLGDYVDALRVDDATASAGVIKGLADRLSSIVDTLTAELESIQQQVTDRIGETRSALEALSG